MLSLIKNKIVELSSICEKNQVAAIYLFGSAVTDSFNNDSDLDFAVVFHETLSPIERGDAFFGLMDDLESLFNRNIDLVSYQVIKNPVFKAELDRTKISLYAAA